MIDLVCINKPSEEDFINDTVEQSRAVVPTIDIYTVKTLFKITQKMVEDTVDQRVSLLEKRIGERDKEIMRAIRKIQAQTVMKQNKIQLPWWQKLFCRGK